MSHFSGREVEVAELSEWIMQEHCRLIALLGMGGIGKSTLASLLGQRLTAHFEAVLWRSVRDAPSCEELVADCTTFFSETPPAGFPVSLEQRINQLVARLQASRCLLVLDNLETLLVSSDPEGNYLPGYEGYARLIGRLAEAAHQSCVLLTSREKPREIEALEGVGSPVRSLRLVGLDEQTARLLLADKGLVGTPGAWQRLVAGYAGNPLALKIVAQAVCDLFGGDLDRFLEEGELVFNGVRPLLRQQVGRLSALEHLLLTWLAVLREWTELSALLQVLHPRVLRGQMLEALEALGRRSLLERGQQASFSLQSVVMEYLTDELSERLAEEIVQGDPQQLRRYALEQAQTKDYVREIQVRLLVHPLLERLRAELGGDALVEARLLDLLALFRTEDTAIQGYGPANILSLLKALRGHLRGLDLSRLAIRGVYLQGIEMQDTTLAGSLIQEALFTASFDALNGVAISSTGEYWAASSRRGEVRVWQAGGQTLYHIWQAHTERAWSLAFGPDGRMLVSGSWDGLVKLWEVETGSLVWSGRHTGIINSVAFAPDGSLLASAGANETILWEVKSGTQAHTLTHPDQVISVAWSPQGQLLATGDVEGRIRLWSVHETEPAICMQTLTAHTKLISELAFAPDGSVLASASYDSTVKLWDVAAGRLDQTLTGHSERIHRVAWSPDGRLLASGGYEKAIWLWDVEQNRYRGTLQGHTDSVLDLAFTPDSRRLLSCGESTLRLWDIESLRCIRVLQGNVEALFDVDWSPDGTRLASGGSDKLVTIFDATEGTPSRVLRGHGGLVFGVAWSPDGRRLASSSWDTTVRVWNPATGESLQVLGASEDPITFFCGLAWSPDGNLLAGTTYLNLPGVLVWEVRLGSPLWSSLGYPTPIRRVAWSPDGTRIAGGGDNGDLYIWGATDGTLLQRHAGDQGLIKSVAWSPDGTRLVSAGWGRESAELMVWDAHSGERLQTIARHPGILYAVVWSTQGERGDILVSGGSDGTLRWWSVDSGECLRVRQAHQGTVQALKVSPDGRTLASCGDDGAITLWSLDSGEHLRTLRRDRPYERLNITGIQGLSDGQKASLRALGAFEQTSVGR